MDERWMIARCLDHSDRRNPLTPLISASAFEKRQRLKRELKPIDLFGSLTEEEQAALRKAVK
jgi:hypothetical protein